MKPLAADARVLLTSGRAAFALELARAFRAAGAKVFVCDSWPAHFASSSRWVEESLVVPEPNRDPSAYARALAEIVSSRGITHVVPVSEEVFFVSAASGALPSGVRVVVDGLEKLARLHDKGEFNRMAGALGLDVPESDRVTSLDGLDRAIGRRSADGKEFVLKPAFSRFAARVRFSWRRPLDLDPIRASVAAGEEWIVQDRARGEEVCSWSVVDRGRLVLHAAYARPFTAGPGAAVAFRSIRHAGIEKWVARFAREHSLTGQFAFDFILEGPDSRPVALECNPRSTSGVHLFRGDARSLAAGILFPESVHETRRPPEGALGMTTALAVLLYGLPQVRSRAKAVELLEVLFRARDALFDARDPFPFFAQFRILARLARESKRRGIAMIEASTRDIEWDGRPIPRE